LATLGGARLADHNLRCNPSAMAGQDDDGESGDALKAELT